MLLELQKGQGKAVRAPSPADQQQGVFTALESPPPCASKGGDICVICLSRPASASPWRCTRCIACAHVSCIAQHAESVTDSTCTCTLPGYCMCKRVPTCPGCCEPLPIEMGGVQTCRTPGCTLPIFHAGACMTDTSVQRASTRSGIVRAKDSAEMELEPTLSGDKRSAEEAGITIPQLCPPQLSQQLQAQITHSLIHAPSELERALLDAAQLTTELEQAWTMYGALPQLRVATMSKEVEAWADQHLRSKMVKDILQGEAIAIAATAAILPPAEWRAQRATRCAPTASRSSPTTIYSGVAVRRPRSWRCTVSTPELVALR